MKDISLAEIKKLVANYPALVCCEDSITKTCEALIFAYQNGNKLLVCGNGGSAADSLHIVGELMKGFALPRRLSKEKQEMLRANCPDIAEYCIENLQSALPAISLVSETGLTTAYANDNAPDLAFAQQVLGHAEKGDVFLGITTSGNSANVLYAAGVAMASGMTVIGLTGESGGRMLELCDICITAPSSVTYQIQEYHLPIYHAICLALEQEFFGI